MPAAAADPAKAQETTQVPPPDAPPKKRKNWRHPIGLWLAFSIPEALNFSSIFTMLHFCADFLFNTPMRFFTFPLSAICGLAKAGSLWHNFHLQWKAYGRNGKRSKEEEEIARVNFLQALWELLNSLGTTGAVITGIVGFFTGAAVGMGISITFAVLLATSTVICTAYAVYFGIKTHRADRAWNALPESERILSDKKVNAEHPLYKQKENYRRQRNMNLIGFGILSILTIGTGVAMIGGFTLPGWIIGGTGCLIGASYSCYNFYHFLKGPSPWEQYQQKKSDASAQNSTTAAVLKTTQGQDATPNVTPEEKSPEKTEEPPLTFTELWLGRKSPDEKKRQQLKQAAGSALRDAQHDKDERLARDETKRRGARWNLCA